MSSSPLFIAALHCSDSLWLEVRIAGSKRVISRTEAFERFKPDQKNSLILIAAASLNAQNELEPDSFLNLVVGQATGQATLS